MGLLDDIKNKASDAIAGATGKLSAMVPSKGKDNAGAAPSGMDMINAALAKGESGDGHSGSSSGDFEGGDEYDDILNDAIKPQRSDILDLLGIPDNYEVPDEVLLVGDLDRVRFDRSSPVGYSEPMVDAFFNSVYDSLVWYHDTLKKRNRDIAKLATQLDKSATDLHNAKINAEMSDGLTVMTGQESTAEQEMQKLQLAVIKLRDENDKLKKQLGAGANSKVPDSRYDDLQNQLGLAQLEIKKLTAQLKRQSFEAAGSDENSLNLSPAMTVQGAPGAGDAPSVPNPFAAGASNGPLMPGLGGDAGSSLPDPAAADTLDHQLAPNAGMPGPSALPAPTPELPTPDAMPGLGDSSLSAPNVTRSNLTGVGTMNFTGRSNEGYSGPQRSQSAAAAEDDGFDVDLSTTGLQGDSDSLPTGFDDYSTPQGSIPDVSMPADMPMPSLDSLDSGSPAANSDDHQSMPGSVGDDDLPSPDGGAQKPAVKTPRKRTSSQSLPNLDMGDMNSDEFFPLPGSMNPDSYDELGISLDDGSGEIDMSDML